jgi:hypothetical protein
VSGRETVGAQGWQGVSGPANESLTHGPVRLTYNSTEFAAHSGVYVLDVPVLVVNNGANFANMRNWF